MPKRRFLKPSQVEKMLNDAREIHGFNGEVEKISIKTIVESAKKNGRIGDKIILVVDPYQVHIPRWQRDLDLIRAREIGTRYDKNLWGTPKLIYCKGKLICVDGMHRIVGALLAGLTNIVVEIIEISEEKAIKIFLDQGVGRKNMSPTDLYRGNIEIGDKDYIEFRDICHKYNIQVKGDDKLENPIGVFTSILDGVRMDKELLEKILILVKKMRWCGEELKASSKSPYSSKVIRSIVKLYAFYEKEEEAMERILTSKCYGSEWFTKNVSDMSAYKIFDTLNEIIVEDLGSKGLKVVGKRTA